MNRSAFYASVRQRVSGVFGTSLSQSQVQGVEAILGEAERRGTSIFHLAAILSEVYHETGGQMQPVKETVYANSKDRNPSDATVIKRLRLVLSRDTRLMQRPSWKADQSSFSSVHVWTQRYFLFHWRSVMGRR